MSNIDVALARAKASLSEFEEAKKTGANSRIAAARVEVNISRQLLLNAKAENSALDAMKSAMSKGASHPVNNLPFAKALTKAAGGRRPGAVPFDRPVVARAVKAYAATIAKALNKTRASVTRQLWDGPFGKANGTSYLPLRKVAKADIDPDAIVAGLDLSDLETLATDDTLTTVASDSARKAIAQLGVEAPDELVNQVNQAARWRWRRTGRLNWSV